MQERIEMIELLAREMLESTSMNRYRDYELKEYKRHDD